MAESKEKYKFLFLGVLLAVAINLTYYFHFILRTGIIFTHFFYIPIIISALWWKRKGLSVTIFLAVMLILSSHFANNEITADDALRAMMFIVIAVVVVILSEGISKREEALQKARDELEIRVKERTAEIAESATRYRTLVKNIPDIVIIADRQGRIQFINRTIAGFYVKQVIGATIYDFIPSEFHETVKNALERVFQTGAPITYEIIGAGTNGEPAWYSTCVGANQRAGQTSSVTLISRDITERKRAEEERASLIAREHAARAEAEVARKLDRLKSMFIASTSHELRTPLNSIIGFTNVLLEGWSGDLNAEQKEQLQIVNSSAKHLLALITDVIDLSKIEAGKIDAHVSEFNLRQVLEEAASTLRTDIGEKGLGLSINVEDIAMKTDRRRLLQCIMNLLSNAVKFTEKGEIKITARIIKNKVHISVTDTGIGIRTEDIPKLFAPFVRLESPLAAKTSGTGLGLYLTKKLAREILGGDMDVKSEYGKGSTFTLRVPVEVEGKA